MQSRLFKLHDLFYSRGPANVLLTVFLSQVSLCVASHGLLGCFSLERLALGLVTLLPVVLLAVGTAVQALSAGGAPLVFDGLTLRSSTVATQLEVSGVAPAVRCLLDRFLELEGAFEPRHGRVVDPGVQQGNIAALDLLVGELLGSKTIN